MLQARSCFPKRSDAIAVHRLGFYTRLHRADQGLCKHTPAFDDGAVDALRNKSFFIEFILKKIMPTISPCITNCFGTAPALPGDTELEAPRPVTNVRPQQERAPAHALNAGGVVQAQLRQAQQHNQLRVQSEVEGRPSISTSIASAGPGEGRHDELQDLANAGHVLRGQLAACKESGDYSKYGELVKVDGVEALKFPDNEQGIQNFRSLLAASKVAIGINGVAVLIRPAAGYPGSQLFALSKDNFKTVGGVTPEGTAISICKGDGKIPNDTRFVDIMDLLYTINEEKN